MPTVHPLHSELGTKFFFGGGGGGIGIKKTKRYPQAIFGELLYLFLGQIGSNLLLAPNWI